MPRHTPVSYSRDAVDRHLRSRYQDIDWSPVVDQLPPRIWRSRWDDLAARHGLPYAARTLANQDCLGTGPASHERQEARPCPR